MDTIFKQRNIIKNENLSFTFKKITCFMLRMHSVQE